jgi:hypothetical protein
MSVIKAVTSTPDTVTVVAETGLRAEIPKDAALFLLGRLLQMYEEGEFAEVKQDTYQFVIDTCCARIAEKAVYV